MERVFFLFLSQLTHKFEENLYTSKSFIIFSIIYSISSELKTSLFKNQKYHFFQLSIILLIFQLIVTLSLNISFPLPLYILLFWFLFSSFCYKFVIFILLLIFQFIVTISPTFLPLFHIFIFPLLSILITIFFYPFIFFCFDSSYSYPLIINFSFSLSFYV